MTNKTMQELNKIEEELQAILTDGKQKEQEYLQEVETATESENEANRAVIKAKQGSDPKAYAKVIADKRTASDIAEYYTGKIEELKNNPYITEAEYNDYTKQIKSEMDKINEEMAKRASKLLQELEAIKDEIVPPYTKANQLLSHLQNNIYKNSYEKQMADARKNKTSISADRLRNEYKDNSILQGIEYLINSHATQIINTKGEDK
ncbi:hypothetical protein [Carnobacterium pleistocenium]|uniref:hypothetical protein n=1 Tax=Carnobacterium pleistocenium TaxID=181073 RepID=UPI00054D2A2F|nr:hypothetical protein [Carnobacterium pleistocenium]